MQAHFAGDCLMSVISPLPDLEKRRIAPSIWLVILFLLLIAGFLVSLLLGRYPVSPETLIDILFRGETSGTAAIAVMNVRLPRILLSVLVGAGLSAAGAAYQGVFQNPMAAPDVLGASAGAGFGAALAIFIGLSSAGVTALAFAASLATVWAVMEISKRAKGERVLGLVLAGIMVSSLVQAGTSFIKLVADPMNKLPAITYWLMGSLAGATKSELLFVIWPLLLGTAPLIILRWRINLLTLGDDEARALGVNADGVRTIVILSATLITAAAVSVSGVIGWVGLVIPHMMRRLVGNDYRYLMPASILGGGLFLLLVDNLSRNISTAEIPIGILTAFVGAPFFILLITRRNDYR